MMRGVVFSGDRKLDFIEFPDPAPGPGEVVLEMKASGICGSDLHIYRAAKDGPGLGLKGIETAGPIIRGHEPCGVVAAVGAGVSEKEARVGDRVMVHHYWGCTVCPQCRSGWSQLCENQTPQVYGINAHGGHAPYMKVPARTLVALPDELSFEAGAAISCGTGTSYAALRRLNLNGGDTVAIFGQGPVGLAATQIAAAMGASVIALDLNAERLAKARELGADATINASSEEPIAAIRALTRGNGADLALEAAGSAQARIAAIRSTRIWGTVCFVGAGGQVTIDVGPDLMQRQLSASLPCSARGHSRPLARPSAHVSPSIARSRSIVSSPIAGSVSRRRRPISSLTVRAAVRA
jgi:D-arabinose 1-dehydrogenase-like Zn-dependent alcohol dehydrogenase